MSNYTEIYLSVFVTIDYYNIKIDFPKYLRIKNEYS